MELSSLSLIFVFVSLFEEWVDILMFPFVSTTPQTPFPTVIWFVVSFIIL